MTVTLTDQDKTTLRIAAYGAVALLTAAGAAGGKPHRIATDGSIALASATGAVGHVLGENPGAVKLNGKTVAEIADQVLPALTGAMTLLKRQDAAEAENFRGIVTVAIEAATHRSEPSPTLAAMARKITEALDAA
ncbi:hypothetical protein LN042_06175 [Kitasatospora sp. RB6PN24]|uniref:hypothetical protein n=1 Tax=Kitasatospora humi TaxID=2893891 RepID=UPI001E4066C1|nr:hypothetical protein [Kitasatospora humi]MCC9306696.1 hypothetical protein [Kitasatospora humi]